MCGICGIVTTSGVTHPNYELIRRMMGIMRHRGPDGSGCYIDDTAALGHTRLSIIDVAGGAQPLTNEDHSLWITYNGEIFNYVELAKDLASLGHTFRTKSDTEVIVHAWEQWGVRCFERFNGQWALALWNSSDRSLVISRDRMGVRPLYYTCYADTFLFASEIKAIFSDDRVYRGFDPEGLNEIFTFWCPIAPRTAFQGVSELEPGHYAILRKGELESKPYWTIGFPPGGRREEHSLPQNGRVLRDRLVDAVRLRFLRSDVPVAAYLSGGIDSCITAGIITRYTQAPLRTFSIRFTDPEFDEGPYQDEMVRKIGTDHSSIEVSAADIGRVFPDVVRHAERPILRSAAAPLFLLSKLVRDSGYKVVVTGEGSDEILAGYDIFRETKARLFLSRDPSSTKRARIVELLYPWMERSPAKVPSFAHAFFAQNLDPSDPAFSHRPRWDSSQSIKNLLTQSVRERMGGNQVGEELLARMPPEHMGWDPVSRAQWLEMKTLLPGYILSSQGDRMLMAHSIEGRFPFLDPNVVEFANGLPSWHKLLAFEEKCILKREFTDIVPESILKRPKQPYRAPDAASFFSADSPDWVEAVLEEGALRAAGIFEPASVARLVDKCRRNRGEKMSNTDNMRILAVLSTMLVHRSLILAEDRTSIDAEPPEALTVIDVRKGKGATRK